MNDMKVSKSVSLKLSTWNMIRMRADLERRSLSETLERMAMVGDGVMQFQHSYTKEKEADEILQAYREENTNGTSG